ncbi:MAG: purine-cytosine permease [Pycnora praestabilis]|nr:MAG: purine-cytosine permease [Pycnora praestabilis]
MGIPYEYDPETGAEKKDLYDVTEEAHAVPAESFAIGDSWNAKAQRFAGKFGVEQRGIERVPENERTDKSLMNLGTMWLAANMVVSSFAIGALAIPVFDLGFVDSVLTIFFINILAITPVCFFSTFGPRFGLRQMVLSRFFFGYYGVKIIAIFNILACVGWSSVNVIVGAQLLNAVNSDVPGYAGIIIIAAATFIVTLFGYKVVHAYEFYSWIPCFIVFLIVLGEFAHSGKFSNLPMGVGESEAGSVLSFAASVFGFGTGWTSYAADYAVYQPANSSPIKVYAWVFAGLIFPLCFTEMLGVAVMTASINTPSYATGYTESGIGGLLGAVLFPPLGRFGQFLVVVLALSIIGNNCPNIYSVTFSLQVMGRWTARIPRFIWTFIGTVVYCAIAIPGYSHFESVLENFMLVIVSSASNHPRAQVKALPTNRSQGYWLAIYEGISLTEHFVFKKGMLGYQIEIYNQPSKLPPGIAAITAFCFGVFGAVMGMAQVWFIGPIGSKIGTPGYGGDIGFELAFAFSSLSYLGFRTLEIRYFRR